MTALELGVLDPFFEHGPPGPVEVLEEEREFRREARHVGLSAGARQAADVVGESLHVGEDGLDGRPVVGEARLEKLDIARRVHVRNADVVVRVDGPIERLVRGEHDVLDLRKAVDQVGDAVAEADRRRVERDVEGESPGAGEGRGVSARDAVLFEDDDLEALAGEGRRRAEAAEAGSDDDRVVGPGRCLALAVAAREGAPVPRDEGHPGQERFQEIPSFPGVRRHGWASFLSFVCY